MSSGVARTGRTDSGVTVCEQRVLPRSHYPQVDRLLGLIPNETVNEQLERSYWERGGWTRRGNRFVGCYRVYEAKKCKEWRGYVDVEDDGHLEFYIYDGSGKLNSNRCFQPRKEAGLYHVHWHNRTPRTLDAGISSVEAVLSGFRKSHR